MNALPKMPEKANILIVEDEALVRQDLEEFLIDLDYNVIAQADTGESAIAKTLEFKPDLIFMDINLKGALDGIEAAAEIMRRQPTPIIYLTAFSDDKTQKRLKETSPFGYVLKPFDERELRTGIELALQRAKFERELDERRRWYETTLKSIGDGVITTDNGGKITYLNPAAENLVGITLAEAVGQDVRDVLVFYNEHNLDPVENPAVAALDNRRTIFLPSNSMLARRDGQNVPVDDSAALILDERDDPLGVVVVFRDTSEQRRVVKQLIEAKKLEAVGIIAGGIAHNFNNMMLGVMGNLEMVMQTALEEANQRRVNNAYSACEKAAELIRKLLAFARGQSLKPKTIELNQLVEGIRSLSSSLIKGTAELTLKTGEEKIFATVDAVNLEQAVLNLCLNSLAAMPEGGTIRIETKNISVAETGTDATGAEIKPGDYNGVGVIDNGTGMDDATLAQIFVPFFTTKADRKGTGLGLPSVEGFVKQSDGFIVVESELGVGTSIFLYFPRVEAE